MKHTFSYLKTFFLSFILAFFSSAAYGQDNKTDNQGKTETAKTQGDSSGKLVGTYLDRAHAQSTANNIEPIIKNDIYKLQVVVENFGDENDKTALKSIIDNHVAGKKQLFKRQYLEASASLRNVRESINKLMTSLVDRYQKQADDILGKCAETLVDQEIGIGSSRDINIEAAGKTSKKLTDNRIRLIIAYDQFNMANQFRYDDRLSDAITHYRLAKAHGINILVDLAETENDKNKVRNEFKVDLADGENTISK